MVQRLDSQSASDLLRRLHAAVNAHDAAAVAALCSDEVCWTDPAALDPLQGREAVYRFHQDVVFRALPDVSVELIDGPYLAVNGSGVAARLRIRGTMTGPLVPPGFAPTGGPIHFESAEFSHFEDGLLKRHTVVLDMLSLARQVGAVPGACTVGDRIGVRLQHLTARRLRARRR